MNYPSRLLYIIICRGVSYASRVKGLRKFPDAQVRVNQVMTFVLFVHLKTTSITKEIPKQTWVFVRDIVIKMMIARQASTVSIGVNLTPCLGAKARGDVEKTTAYLK